MKLTEAQRKTIATMESMSNEAADQWVDEPRPFGTSDGTEQSVVVEMCYGWYTQEVVIHPDGSLERLD
tara:strand:+ start:599 stop:802 length:204 start_codon:yes stop_codon:yes gene_type:complete